MKRLHWFLLYLLLPMLSATSQVVTPAGTPVPDSYGLWTVDISAGDKYIATGGDDSLLQILDINLVPYRQIKLSKQGAVRSVKWHPSRNLLAIASMKTAWLYNLDTGDELPLEGVQMGSRAIAWSSNGEMLGMADGVGTVLIWNKDGKLIRRIQKMAPDNTPDRKSFLGFDWHPANNRLVTVGDEIRVYDTSGVQLAMFRHRKEFAGILSVKWHPSGDFFVTGDYGHENEGIPTLLQFWKPDGTLIREIKDSQREYRSLSWNKEGTRLATASDALRVRDHEGRLLYTGNNQDKVLWGVDWNSTSSQIVTVTYDGRAKEGKGSIRSWSPKGKLIKAIY